MVTFICRNMPGHIASRIWPTHLLHWPPLAPLLDGFDLVL
jgi:hypothetical protein